MVGMRTDFTFVAVMILAAALLMGVALVGASLLRPKKPSKAKLETYECGMETVGDAWVQFRVQYYIFALIFVVFDVETVFLYPWAVSYGKLGLFAFAEMLVFVGILVVGLVYAWKKQALRWW